MKHNTLAQFAFAGAFVVGTVLAATAVPSVKDSIADFRDSDQRISPVTVATGNFVDMEQMFSAGKKIAGGAVIDAIGIVGLLGLRRKAGRNSGAIPHNVTGALSAG